MLRKFPKPDDGNVLTLLFSRLPSHAEVSSTFFKKRKIKKNSKNSKTPCKILEELSKETAPPSQKKTESFNIRGKILLKFSSWVLASTIISL